MLDVNALPNDIEGLKRLIIEHHTAVLAKDIELREQRAVIEHLHLAFSHEVEVEKYLDTTEGVVTALPDGRCWISEVILKPRITFNSQQQVAGVRHSALSRTRSTRLLNNNRLLGRKDTARLEDHARRRVAFGPVAACRGARNAYPLPNRNRNPRL